MEHNENELLNAALVFAKALGFFLKKNEGIIIKLEGDMNFGEDIHSVMVYNDDPQIKIGNYENENAPDGQLFWLHDDDDKRPFQEWLNLTETEVKDLIFDDTPITLEEFQDKISENETKNSI